METLYIVVPCYNEEEVLPGSSQIMAEKLNSLKNSGTVSARSRIMLVDDGSADSTWGIINSLHTDAPDTFDGVRLRCNRGHQNALLAGLMLAKDLADAAVSMDADLQDDINAVDDMIHAYDGGAHIVCGVRRSRETDTFLKRTTARGYYKLMNIFGAKLIYDHADFRLMDTRALNALSMYHGDDLFLRGLITRLGFEPALVEYDRSPRMAGESKYTLKKMLRLAASGLGCAGLRPQSVPRPADPYIEKVLHV